MEYFVLEVIRREIMTLFLVPLSEAVNSAPSS